MASKKVITAGILFTSMFVWALSLAWALSLREIFNIVFRDNPFVIFALLSAVLVVAIYVFGKKIKNG